MGPGSYWSGPNLEPLIFQERQRAFPRFAGGPFETCPGLRLPRVPGTLALRAPGFYLPHSPTVSAVAVHMISAFNPHGLLPHLYTSRPQVTQWHGNTRCRPARYGFDRAGLSPSGSRQKISPTHFRSSCSALFAARRDFTASTAQCDIASLGEVQTQLGISVWGRRSRQKRPHEPIIHALVVTEDSHDYF